MRKRGVLLIGWGLVLLLFLPLFVARMKVLDELKEDLVQEDLESMERRVYQLPGPIHWLGREWIIFLQSSMHQWKTAETPQKRAEELQDIRDAVTGLRHDYGIRVVIWLLLGLSTLGTGLLVSWGRGHVCGLLVILSWLGGSPIPGHVLGYLTDDNDAIVLAGLLPMLVASSIVCQRLFQVVVGLTHTRPRLGRSLLAVILLSIFGVSVAATVAGGGIDEGTWIRIAAGVITSLVVGGLLALLRRR